MEYKPNYETSSLGKKIANTGLALLVAGTLFAGIVGCTSTGTYNVPVETYQHEGRDGGGNGGGGNGGGGEG
ncbi:hypothetical protein J4226_00365 [Candidatus Pacearchaeota archaeon]|nr:hypothetical protein [Candidatus Pacearchaeota archaeon]